MPEDKFNTLTCVEKNDQDPLLAEIFSDVAASSVLGAMRSYVEQLRGKLDNNARPYQKLARLFMAGRTPTRVDGHHYGTTVGLRTGDEGPLSPYGNFLGYLWGTTFGPVSPWVGKSFSALSDDTVRDYTGSAGDPSRPCYLGINHFLELDDSLTNRISFSAVTFWFHAQSAPPNERAGYGYQKNGGLFIAQRAPSVYASSSREVFGLNYRWRQLGNLPPLSYLIDELVEISDGLYLGQLLFATRHVLSTFDGARPIADYKYEHFGYFLLVDDSWRDEILQIFPNVDPSAQGSARPAMAVASSPVGTTFPAKFTTFTFANPPDGNCNDATLKEVLDDLKGRATILDLLKFYSDQLTHLDNNSPYFTRLHELFNRGLAPDGLEGYFHGAVVTFHAAGYYKFFNLNTLNAGWVAGKFFSPWTGKTFSPVTQEQLTEYTGGLEKGDVPTFWGANTDVFRTALQKFTREAMKLANVWLEDASPDETQRYGYQAKSFFFIAHKGTSVNPDNGNKRVFLFNYRWPKLRTIPPDCYCIDELVQIADGLYLGQLNYSTELLKKYDPAAASAAYNYQLFGYFLLMDDEWQRRRIAIGLDPHEA